MSKQELIKIKLYKRLENKLFKAECKKCLNEIQESDTIVCKVVNYAFNNKSIIQSSGIFLEVEHLECSDKNEKRKEEVGKIEYQHVIDFITEEHTLKYLSQDNQTRKILENLKLIKPKVENVNKGKKIGKIPYVNGVADEYDY